MTQETKEYRLLLISLVIGFFYMVLRYTVLDTFLWVLIPPILSLLYILTNDNYNKLKNSVFNVGEEKMNYSKKDIAYEVKKKVDYYLHFASFGTDEDKRNYEGRKYD